MRRIGPMAQDWDRAFGFSGDTTTIDTGDFDGVNLAGIQALRAGLAASREENAALGADGVAGGAAAAAGSRAPRTLTPFSGSPSSPPPRGG